MCVCVSRLSTRGEISSSALTQCTCLLHLHLLLPLSLSLHLGALRLLLHLPLLCLDSCLPLLQQHSPPRSADTDRIWRADACQLTSTSRFFLSTFFSFSCWRRFLFSWRVLAPSALLSAQFAAWCFPFDGSPHLFCSLILLSLLLLVVLLFLSFLGCTPILVLPHARIRSCYMQTTSRV